MKRRCLMCLAATTAAGVLLVACSASGPATPQDKMSFFVISTKPGKGADLGGLEGADRVCQNLAASGGAGGRTWRAYLSTIATPSSPAVNARDRIGNGPWYNVKGQLIASNLDELHGTNNISKQTALTEKGEVVSGRGDLVVVHDMLTGSSPDGRAINDGQDHTCRNWTSSTDGSAMVGHHDRNGTNNPPASMSWNSSHGTPGCSPDALKKVGGGGLFYCFAQK